VSVFSDQLLTVFLRGVLNLPPGVLRVLNRKPVVIDGQELSPEIQLLLTLKELARLPAAETLPLERARAELKRQQLMVGGRQPIGALRDLEVDGAEGPMRARLYIPAERTGPDPAPTLLFIHGGGWMYGDLESHDPMCRFLAEHSGVQLLSVDYRLSPEHPFPAAVEDCQAAYRWLVDHAADVNADPSRLAVGGDSAGGSLSLSTAVWAAEKGLPMAFQLLVYPGADFVERTRSRQLFGQGFVLTEEFMDLAEQHYFTPGADKAHPDASGLRRVDFPAGVAPAHVVTAGYDPLRDEGEALARLLSDSGIEVDAKRYPSMIHGFAQIVGAGHEARACNAEIADRLHRALS
jgi:acetyl esterase